MIRHSKTCLRALAILAAILFLFACLPPTDERVAGSSTEAGNAGGKVSLVDGSPASDVSVALVARSYLPDTLGSPGLGSAPSEIAGKYYRTRTGTDGRYSFKNVSPGDYRIITIGNGVGALTDPVAVAADGGMAEADQILKPLGTIRGVVKILGAITDTNVFIIPKGTLKTPPKANGASGGFVLDSLPEGEYELVPQCFSCQPVKQGYRVRIHAGQDTLLTDTLFVYPEYFNDFPESGELVVRAAWLPLAVGGKLNRRSELNGIPSSVRWEWNGAPLAGKNTSGPGGISFSEASLDSSLFQGAGEGTLRVTLEYPDTAIARSWHVTLDAANRIWPLSAVSVDSAFPVSGALKHTWRFHVAGSLPLGPADVAFWGIRSTAEANQNALPEWLTLPVDNGVEASLASGTAAPLSFILVPDAKLGGRVVRPRWDEALSDFREIRFLERAQLGFTDSLEPSMLPGGLVASRQRGAYLEQRYRIDSAGHVEELLGPFPRTAAVDSLSMPRLLLFYRSGMEADGFAWDKPLRDAAIALAVTREGLAVRLDGSGMSLQLADGELTVLKAMLAPLSRDPPALSDTGTMVPGGALEYVWSGGRGLLFSPGSGSPADTLRTELNAWMLRNGLRQVARFPLSAGTRYFLAFTADASGLRYTGDTLAQEASADGDGIRIREYLTAGSPGKAGDSAVFEFGLRAERDSLVASVAGASVASRLFGRLEGGMAIFPLTALGPVAPSFLNGLPALSTGGNTLSGFIAGSMMIRGRAVADPALWLDGRPILKALRGQGVLYSPAGGVERTWNFSGRNETVYGWDGL